MERLSPEQHLLHVGQADAGAVEYGGHARGGIREVEPVDAEVVDIAHEVAPADVEHGRGAAEDAGEVGTDLREKGKKFVAESRTKVSEFVEKGKARYSKAFKKQAPAVEEEVTPVEEKTDDLIQE